MYDKMIFADNLNSLLKLSGDRQSDIARLLQVSKSTVSSYCAGKQMPRMDKIEILAQHFGVNNSDLIERERNTDKRADANGRIVPRVGRIACGVPILAEENIERFDVVPEMIKCDFTLVCVGDSMINARIYDGDIVCIKKQETAENGQIAAVMIDNEECEATLKRVRYIENGVALWPENNNYTPLVFTGEDANRVHIIGIATHFISEVR